MLRTFQQFPPSKSSILVDQLLHRRLYSCVPSALFHSVSLVGVYNRFCQLEPFFAQLVVAVVLVTSSDNGWKSDAVVMEKFCNDFYESGKSKFFDIFETFFNQSEKAKKVIKSHDRKKQQRPTVNLNLLVCAFPYQKRPAH